MSHYILKAKPLTRENFAPYGSVIGLQDSTELSAIARVADTADMAVKVIAGTHKPLPYGVEFFESHPKSTQAFIPMDGGVFCVLVAPATGTDSFDIQSLEAFITDGTQGIQYHTGTWHAPFSFVEAGKKFVVLDRHPNAGDSKDINIKFYTPQETIEIESATV